MDSSSDDNPVFAYGTLKVIFVNLNIRDLFTVAKVCRRWYEVSQIVRKQRVNRPNILLYHLRPMELTRELVDLSNILDPEDPLINYPDPESCQRLTGMTNPQNIPDCDSRFARELEPSFWNDVNSQYYEPSQIVCFKTPSHHRRTGEDPTCANSGLDLFRRIGKVCPCISVVGEGLVLTLPDKSACLENECLNRSLYFPMMCGLVLPKVPGLKISMFSFGRNSSLPASVTPENCFQILKIDDGDNVKGILLFQVEQRSLTKEAYLLKAVQEYLKINPKVAFGGGLFRAARTTADAQAVIGCGLVISGDYNVRVGTTSLGDPGVTDDNLKNLQKFKEAGIVGTNDFAFMFCCNGRGLGMHRDSHIESSLFRSQYPNVPLIGGFTGGEYFHPYVSGQLALSSPPPAPPRKLSVLQFSYRTIFVYVSCAR